MKHFIVHDETGKILRTGCCQNSMLAAQAGPGERVMEGVANDLIHKIVDDKVTNKTPAEVEAADPKPREISPADRPAHITMGELQNLRDRLTTVEERMSTGGD